MPCFSYILSILLGTFCLLNHCSCGNEDVIEADRKGSSRIKRLNNESLDSDAEDLIIADHFANEALKYIEAKYRDPRKLQVISILGFTKDPKDSQYRNKTLFYDIEVGYTDCLVLSLRVGNCSLVTDMGANKICDVRVELRPGEEQPLKFQVSCDIDEEQIEINKKAQAEILFKEFLDEYKPSYLNNPKEMSSRFEVFKQNIEKIHEFNVHERGTARYGITKFSDLTDEEFNNKYLGFNTNISLASSNLTMTNAIIPNGKLPVSFDWRKKKAVTNVKNQGDCGSGWAFSVIGNIEGQWARKTRKLVSLSAQEVLDCDQISYGCGGGLPLDAYSTIMRLGGLETEKDYPYEGEADTCKFNKSLSMVQISASVSISQNETSMAMWMVKHGPISVGINTALLKHYKNGGIVHPKRKDCSPERINHAVLIVGFGIKDNTPFWIVKNSWGSEWGDDGYFKVYRGDGTCGINTMATSAML